MRAREEFEVCKSKYEVRALIALLLVGAFSLVWGGAPDESYAELSAPSQIDVAREAAAATAATDLPRRRHGMPSACTKACL
jgi:hypothetical protein